jgi:DNA protecting protein DprA
LLFVTQMQDDVQTMTIDENSPFAFLLKEIPQSPKTLRIQGRTEAFGLLDRLPYYGFAVVGTRTPQPRSLLQIRTRLRELKQSSIASSVVIVSGLALGVDACAHEEALALDFPTIAVLGFGFDIFYPRENNTLRNRIVESGGLLITEYPDEEQALPGYFIQRNRIIAGLAQATWIVEAGFKSGALNTAKWAREGDRKYFATPSFPGDPAFAGNQDLLSNQKPRAMALWTSEDLSDAWLDLHSAAHPKTKKKPAPLRGAEMEPVELLRYQVALLTSQQGGAAVPGLFDWSLGLGWSPFCFYAALQKAIESGLIQDRNGILVG